MQESYLIIRTLYQTGGSVASKILGDCFKSLESKELQYKIFSKFIAPNGQKSCFPHSKPLSYNDLRINNNLIANAEVFNS